MSDQAGLSEVPHEAAAGAVVLVVDDNEFNRDLLRQRLERDGHSVVQASDGEQALQTLRSEPVDLVLLDIMMPIMDGYETLAHMQKDRWMRHIPVIVITAVDDIEAAVRCIESGAEDFIGKPFNPVLLRARVSASSGQKTAP